MLLGIWNRASLFAHWSLHVVGTFPFKSETSESQCGGWGRETVRLRTPSSGTERGRDWIRRNQTLWFLHLLVWGASWGFSTSQLLCSWKSPCTECRCFLFLFKPDWVCLLFLQLKIMNEYSVWCVSVWCYKKCALCKELGSLNIVSACY